MVLIQQGKDECTLRNGDTVAYHVAIAGDVNNDINVPELTPRQQRHGLIHLVHDLEQLHIINCENWLAAW